MLTKLCKFCWWFDIGHEDNTAGICTKSIPYVWYDPFKEACNNFTPKDKYKRIPDTAKCGQCRLYKEIDDPTIVTEDEGLCKSSGFIDIIVGKNDDVCGNWRERK